MIITKQKEMREILSAVGELKSLFLIGCGDCATLCKTGGTTELAEMQEQLAKSGITVTGTDVVPATCHELDTARILRKHKQEVATADGVLVMACGAGVQAVGDSNEKPVISGCDSLFIGNSQRQMHFYEKCSACGDCVLNETGGLCPETRCPKSLHNGPCGGAVSGKCEVNHDEPCVWIEIYHRLKSQGRLELMENISHAKDSREAEKPRKLEVPRQKK